MNNPHFFTPAGYASLITLKKSWAAFFLSEENRPRKEEVAGWREVHGKAEQYTFKRKIPGRLRAEHFMLYNLLRGKPLHRGFSMSSPGGFSSAYECLSGASLPHLERLLVPFVGVSNADDVHSYIRMHHKAGSSQQYLDNAFAANCAPACERCPTEAAIS